MNTFGSITYDGGRYLVDLKPHVSRRFKSLFPSIKKTDTPPYALADRPDTASDLLWFFQRYPVAVDPDADRRMRDGETRYLEARRETEEIIAPGWLPPAPVGFRDGRAPYPYQARAATLAQTTGRLLLLDDVGLGKTVSALAMLADRRFLPAVIVVPAHVSTQWIEEYVRVFTRLAAYEIRTTKPETLPPADLYIFRYSNLAGWIDHAGEIGHKAIVFDEIQELRHGRTTGKGQAANRFAMAESVNLRTGLTATPIYNYGSEIFNVVEFIAPGALGTYDEFIIEWCTSKGSHWIVADPDALGSYLREEAIALRRTERDEEVASQLPALNRLLIEVDWNAGDVQEDADLRKALAQIVVGGSFTERGRAARELDLMLRQETGIAKARAVAAYVRILVEGGETVLVAGWHREVYRIWNEALTDLNPVMYTGSESTKQKAEAKRAFIDGRANIMIMSLRSGAGTDGLQDVCSNIVLGEFDWSPQVHNQIIGRLRRPGQENQVTAHFLHTDGGSDPVMLELNGLKASQSHSILDPYSQPVQAQSDESRIRRLALAVLRQEET